MAKSYINSYLHPKDNPTFLPQSYSESEGPIRRPKRGSEWAPIKISLTENRLSPKITTKGSHMSLPRSHSLNIPTNPRNKFQLKVMRKLYSRTRDLGKSAFLGDWDGLSVIASLTGRHPRRTVHGSTMDRPY
jgi:hypothetical protein